MIFDTFEKHPHARYVFEASGYTIDEIAKRTPDVLQKLRDAIKSGQCEFIGAPYAHPVMANIPEEDGYWSCEFAMRPRMKSTLVCVRKASGTNPHGSSMSPAPLPARGQIPDPGF